MTLSLEAGRPLKGRQVFRIIQQYCAVRGAGSAVVAALHSLRLTVRPVQLQTAAGPLTVQTIAPMFVPELHQSIQPLVLQDSPAVLSLGKRCVEDGYTFMWPAGELPRLLAPNGSEVPLIVRQNVPYVQARLLATPAPVSSPARGALASGAPPLVAARVLAPRPDVAQATAEPIRGDPPPPCAKVDVNDLAPPEPSSVPLTDLLSSRLSAEPQISLSDPCSLHHVLTHLPKVPFLPGGQDAAEVAQTTVRYPTQAFWRADHS